ncbi:MAG: glycosyltransferase, partial [Candidatus Eisenbacteria bacterium]|nr:glycosyltransferase [Candidatus Eisenbacteria bacterium]
MSVIIPLWREGDRPAALLDVLDRSPWVREVLAVEAEGDPDPLRLRRWKRVRFLETAPGRARQMNAGASAAGGELLLFLHADSMLDPGALERVCAELAVPGPIAVSFRLRFRERGVGLAILAWAGRMLSSIQPWFLGDQGLALRRPDFHEDGGFPDVAILEDWILVRRLRSRGRLLIVEGPHWTSGRRFLRRGILRQLWTNLSILFRYGGGEPLDVLAEAYRRTGPDFLADESWSDHRMKPPMGAKVQRTKELNRNGATWPAGRFRVLGPESTGSRSPGR